MKTTKKQYNAAEKTKIALEAIKGELTIAQISSKYGVHATQISKWKQQALESMQSGFASKASKEENDQHELIDKLYRQIGQLSIECDWLKKNLNCLSLEDKKKLINLEPEISIRRQCELLNLSRTSLYYKPKPISDRDLFILNKVDEIYTEHPYYGSRRMKEELLESGIEIGRQKISTFYRLLGLETVYPKANLSKRNYEHKVYPYLLRYLPITKANQVWSADVTYIRLKHGFVYLVAIIDWYSRRILSWRLSTSLSADFCVEALQEALDNYPKPEIFNTDQGSTFTANDFVNLLIKYKISISMDGRGRALDNVFIERFWRSLKQEKIYLVELNTVQEAKTAINEYMEFYNFKRKHQSLNYEVPNKVYSCNNSLMML